MKLGVNIDHIAVLREARRVNDPDILEALYVATRSGADQITIHLREDRRHIQDMDAYNIVKHSSLPVNLECSLDKNILGIVCELAPYRATLVPEKREEITTEGGLDVLKYQNEIKKAIELLNTHDIEVSLFVDPDEQMIKSSYELGASMVELHTGSFANLFGMLYGSLANSNHSIKELELGRSELKKRFKNSIKELENSAKYAKSLGLEVAAGHGLNYNNIGYITAIKEIEELNIGQSIVARSVFSGLSCAIKDIKSLIS
ncbi:MAG: pyridoxine 5'-phosphate synthase [Sulfurimonas sp.]|jgi:pyridoxine 5-phosphate synthase|nr:pyridoxine 5'-phosphate synthase [Sulfurimonadaceae bacterium]